MDTEDISVDVATLSPSYVEPTTTMSDAEILHMIPKIQCTRIEGLHAIAVDMHLSCPLGRAIYAVSRMLNSCHVMNSCDIMARANESTAHRWRKHVAMGGSLRSLKRSVEEQRVFAQARRDRLLPRGAEGPSER